MSSKSLADQAIIATLINSEYDFARNIIEKFPYLKVYLHIRFMFRFFHILNNYCLMKNVCFYFSIKKYIC